MWRLGYACPKGKAVTALREKEIMLEIGTQAPDFELLDQDGVARRLSDYRGTRVVLYFYPKDNTAGCTRQACGFAELHPQFTQKGAVVLGVSKDSVASHKRFQEKLGLPFTLLSDPDHEVIEAYGAWQEKKNYGKTYMGIVRSTFLIDENGMVLRASERVKAQDNPQDELDALGAL